MSSSGSSTSDRSFWSFPQQVSAPSSAHGAPDAGTKIGHKRRPSIISVSGARHLIRTGSLGGVAESLYDMTPVLVASEDNEHMNVLVDAYAGRPLDAALDLGQSKSEYSHQTKDWSEKESSSRRQRSSGRFSGIFRRG